MSADAGQVKTQIESDAQNQIGVRAARLQSLPGILSMNRRRGIVCVRTWWISIGFLERVVVEPMQPQCWPRTPLLRRPMAVRFANGRRNWLPKWMPQPGARNRHRVIRLNGVQSVRPPGRRQKRSSWMPLCESD